MKKEKIKNKKVSKKEGDFLYRFFVRRKKK
jgi:hypothetical protein